MWIVLELNFDSFPDSQMPARTNALTSVPTTPKKRSAMLYGSEMDFSADLSPEDVLRPSVWISTDVSTVDAIANSVVKPVQVNSTIYNIISVLGQGRAYVKLR